MPYIKSKQYKQINKKIKIHHLPMALGLKHRLSIFLQKGYVGFTAKNSMLQC